MWGRLALMQKGCQRLSEGLDDEMEGPRVANGHDNVVRSHRSRHWSH